MTEARRDRWGRYQIVPPEGGRPVGYTRATTVAKTLDDGGGLIPWKATATVVGALRRPGILASWQALIAEHPDPWYGSSESKARCKKLVEQAAEAGGSTDRADIGTALHALIEQGAKTQWETIPILQPGMQADIDAYRRTMDAAGILIDPAYVEAIVCLDEFQVAGTSDNLTVFVPGIGNVTADLKTGTDLQYSWQAIAIQLASYANADNVYVQGDAADGSQDRRLPMPEVSKEWGMVIHLPAGEARCALHLVDLVAGWEAFKTSMWTRRWRSRKDVAKPFGAVPSQPTAAPAEVPDFDAPPRAVASSPAPAALPPAAAQGSIEPPPFDEPAASPAQAPAPAVEPARAAVGVEAARPSAPAATPTPAEQLAAVRTAPDEGGPADAAAVTVLAARYMTLRPTLRSGWLKELALQAIQAHVPYLLSGDAGLHTMRRFEITRGLIILVEHDCTDDETLRCILATLIGDCAQFAAVKPGHAVGSLDADQAALFAHRAEAFVAGTIPASVGDDGVVRLHFPEPVAA